MITHFMLLLLFDGVGNQIWSTVMERGLKEHANIIIKSICRKKKTFFIVLTIDLIHVLKASQVAMFYIVG